MRDKLRLVNHKPRTRSTIQGPVLSNLSSKTPDNRDSLFDKPIYGVGAGRELRSESPANQGADPPRNKDPF